MTRAKKADIYTESLELHRKHKGKIEVYSKVPVKNRKDWEIGFSPETGSLDNSKISSIT